VKAGRFTLFFLTIAAPLLCPARAPAQTIPHRPSPSIVVLNSYHDGFRWSDEETAGLLQRLREVYPDVDLLIEYMDAKRRPDERNAALVKDYLVRKYRGFRPDIVVALDNPALEMLFRYHDELFSGVPIVFLGVSDLASMIVPPGVAVTGVAEVTDLVGTLHLAFSLHPDARHVLIVSDDTTSGRAVQREAEAEVRQFADRATFEFLPPSTWDEAVARISSLSPDSLLMILSYATDRTGHALSLSESTRVFTARCPVPAYALHETRLGHGIVGGMLLRGVEHGRRAGDLALRVLDGEPAPSIPVDARSTSRPLFDYREIVRFHIPQHLLPRDSVIINRPVNAFNQYPLFSGIMIGLVVLLVILASLLAANVFRLREAERGLTRSQANLSALIESTGDSICSRDRDGALIAFNSAFARIMREYSGAEVKPGMRAVAYLPAAGREAVEALTQRMLRDGRAFDLYEAEVGGQKRSLEVSVHPIRAGGEVIGSVESIRDVTERVRSERALRESEEKLLQAHKMEAVGRLAGGIAHDFNNLLTVIKAYADMALDAQSRGAVIRDELHEIQLAVSRAAALTGQLLAFSRKQVLQPTVFNLNALIREMTKMLSRVIGEDIDLSTSLDPGLWNIHADQGQIQQVILNLVLNARDAMPSGGKLRIVTENMPAATGASEGRSAATEQPGGDTVALTVSDTGLGMDKETLSRIFEPFFTTKEEGRGTGLGLSTAYGVVQQSGGTITCASTPSAGTSFRIGFPRTEGREEAPADVGGRAGVWTGRGTILVAEDEPAVRAFVVATLTRAGYTVRQAEDGEEALKLLVSSPERIDLLISDVVMPRLGGKELSLRAREVSPGSRILFISGYIGDAVAERGSAEDRIRVLRKPFGPRELLAEVRSILNGS